MINLFFLNDFLFQFIFIFGAANLFIYSLSNYFVYFNDKEDDDSIKDKKEDNPPNPNKKPIPYEEKYMKEYKKRCEDQHNNSIEKRNLKTSFLIEKTPLGNVAIYYNQERECFEYYSDNTIPYRYLETVGRKYVLTFDCIELYIDMEAEVQKQKEKLEEQKRFEKEAKETKDPMVITNNTNETKESRKNVFAKLKNYNKSSNPIQPSSQPTRQNQDQEINKPQNQSQNQSQNIKKPNTIRYNNQPNSNSSSSTVLLKEKANNYLSKGRFSNLTFLQPVKKEIFDKNYKMSFKDFKVGVGGHTSPLRPPHC